MLELELELGTSIACGPVARYSLPVARYVTRQLYLSLHLDLYVPLRTLSHLLYLQVQIHHVSRTSRTSTQPYLTLPYIPRYLEIPLPTILRSPDKGD